MSTTFKNPFNLWSRLPNRERKSSGWLTLAFGLAFLVGIVVSWMIDPALANRFGKNQTKQTDYDI